MNKDVIEKLKAPFQDKELKVKKTKWGKKLTYIEGHAVINRLNEVFENNWNFIIKDYKIEGNNVVVLGELSVKIDNELIIKQSFGGGVIEDTPIDLANEAKRSSTDALKKCASLLGVGLYLYNGDNDTEETPKEKEANKKEKGPDLPQVVVVATANQVNAIRKMASAKKINDLQVFINTTLGVEKTLESVSEAEAKKIITSLNSYVG